MSRDHISIVRGMEEWVERKQTVDVRTLVEWKVNQGQNDKSFQRMRCVGVFLVPTNRLE